MDEALRHEREQLKEQAQGLKDELRKAATSSRTSSR